jgi:aldehyde dehydrogenase (NAD+)
MTLTLGQEPLSAGLLIGGREVPTTAAGSFEHLNPATGSLLGHGAIAGADEVDEAVAAARGALVSWRQTSPSRRRAILQDLGRAYREHADEFAALTTAESGIPAPVAATIGPATADWFDYFAGWTDKLRGATIPVEGAFDYTQQEPVGVVAVLLTWNTPAATIGATVAPALAAGCTVVLKPPELAPFTSALFGRLCNEVGLPPGVINIVTGAADTGDALVRHPGIDKISFTGGRDIARKIQAAAAESVTPLILELGGKSANIIFSDADLDYAATCAAVGLLALNGQTCIAPTRLLVHEDIHDALLERVVAQVQGARIGNPAQADVQVGPVISQRAVDRIRSIVDQAKADGGEILTGTEPLEGAPAGGYFVRPTVVGGVKNDSRVAQQEVFGPVLAVTTFADDEEAVALANDVEYGLAAYLHTNDVTRALTMASRLDAGNIAVNGPSPLGGPATPFGGFKDSGYGKQGGLEGLMEFVRTKNVVVHTTRPF